MTFGVEQKYERGDVSFAYSLRNTKRTRRLRITVYPGGRVVLSHPRFVTNRGILRFLSQYETWVAKEVEKMKHVIVPEARLLGSRKEYKEQKEKARAFVHERLHYFNLHYKLAHGRVAIKNMKSRWGSCSGKRNLNFHYKIVSLPPELADYLIVHELSHVKELNHGERFWSLVGETLPNYTILRTRLRKLY